MKLIIKYLFVGAIAITLCTAYGENPKIISSSQDNSSLEDGTGVFADSPSSEAKMASPEIETSNNQDVHTVLVKEILPTSKYVYMYVTEKGGAPFWIATIKQEVEVGETYIYRGGLLKTNFESKEHNRIFDKMYLVSRVVPVNHDGANAASVNTAPKESDRKTLTKSRNIDRKGSIKIAELVTNSEKYDGQIIQISGECVKVNPHIMGKHWIHLKDGSQDDYDLVITSDEIIPEDQVVTMKGKVVLNKDFGAGYRYDILLEEGVVVQ